MGKKRKLKYKVYVSSSPLSESELSSRNKEGWPTLGDILSWSSISIDMVLLLAATPLRELRVRVSSDDPLGLSRSMKSVLQAALGLLGLAIEAWILSHTLLNLVVGPVQGVNRHVRYEPG